MCSLLTLTERSQMGFKAICFQIVKLVRFHISSKHTQGAKWKKRNQNTYLQFLFTFER